MPNGGAQQGGQTVSMQAPGPNDHPGEWTDGYGYSAQQQVGASSSWNGPWSWEVMSSLMPFSCISATKKLSIWRSRGSEPCLGCCDVI
jgi:hypothetical protein